MWCLPVVCVGCDACWAQQQRQKWMVGGSSPETGRCRLELSPEPRGVSAGCRLCSGHGPDSLEVISQSKYNQVHRRVRNNKRQTHVLYIPLEWLLAVADRRAVFSEILGEGFI